MLKLSKEFKVGILTLISIFLFIFGYNFLKGKNILGSDRTFYAIYDNVEGLSNSSSIEINGLQVGAVTKIDFTDTGKLLVTLTVRKDFQFSKNSIAKIHGGGFIGGKTIAIIPMEGTEIAVSGDTLRSKIEEGLMELANEKIKPLQTKIESVLTTTDSLMFGINDILDESSRKNIKMSIASLSETMQAINKTAVELNSLLAQNKSKINNTMTNLEGMSAKLNSLSDTLSQMNVKQLVTNMEGIISDFKQISSNLEKGKGTAGKFLQDDKVYNNLERATKQMEELLQDIKLNPKRYVHFSLFGKKPKEYKKPKDSLK